MAMMPRSVAWFRRPDVFCYEPDDYGDDRSQSNSDYDSDDDDLLAKTPLIPRGVVAARVEPWWGSVSDVRKLVERVLTTFSTFLEETLADMWRTKSPRNYY
jgi:hypothetical protein